MQGVLLSNKQAETIIVICDERSDGIGWFIMCLYKQYDLLDVVISPFPYPKT